MNCWGSESSDPKDDTKKQNKHLGVWASGQCVSRDGLNGGEEKDLQK